MLSPTGGANLHSHLCNFIVGRNTPVNMLDQRASEKTGPPSRPSKPPSRPPPPKKPPAPKFDGPLPDLLTGGAPEAAFSQVK